MAIATPGNSLPNRLMRMTGQYFDPGNLKLLSYLCWLVGIADLCRIYGYVDMMSSIILQVLQSQQSGVYNDMYSDTFSCTVTHLSGSSRIFEPPLHWSPSRHFTGGPLVASVVDSWLGSPCDGRADSNPYTGIRFSCDLPWCLCGSTSRVFFLRFSWVSFSWIP